MGAFLLTGLTLAGAAVGLGRVFAVASRLGVTASPHLAGGIRSAAIVLGAFCQGMGTFGDVAGLLAIFVDHAGETTGAMVVAGPSVAGAVIGLVLVLRPDPADHGLRGLGVAFILGLGTLGIVVGILAVMVGAGAAVGGVGVLTLAGIVALIACVSIGLRGGQALERVSRGGAPPNQATAWALKAVLPFYLVGVLAVLFRSGRRARALTSASHSFYSSEIAAPGAAPLGSLPLGQ